MFSCAGRGNRPQAATMAADGLAMLIDTAERRKHLGGYRKTCWAKCPHGLHFYQVDLAGGSLQSARVRVEDGR